MALKCYTRQKKNGGNYTNCVDDKGKQMREKDRKKVLKKKPIKRKKLVIVDKPKAQNDISVASGAPNTTTPFNSTTPRNQPISIEEELGLMPQAQLNAQMANVRNLVAKAKAIRRVGAAKKSVSEQKSALSSSAPKPKGEKFQYSSGNSRLGGVAAPRMSFMSNPNY